MDLMILNLRKDAEMRAGSLFISDGSGFTGHCSASGGDAALNKQPTIKTKPEFLAF